MAVQATDDLTESAAMEQVGTPVSVGGHRRSLPAKLLRHDVADLAIALQQLLDLGPGENPVALKRVASLIDKLNKTLPESHFRDERLRDLSTDFALWFSRAPRLQFDYNDEALRSMLQVDIHRLKTAG